jgi:pimeloyl-ACP methyl ester carboxylesterase
MNDVEELKQFAFIHARAQRIFNYDAVVSRVDNDRPDGAGSWVHEWLTAGRALEDRGRLMDACRYYNMARFPYVDGPARQMALERCVEVFTRWRDNNRAGIERIDIDLPTGRVSCWAEGLSATDPKPLMLITGGITSIKEQWAQGLVLPRQLGMAGVAFELPGVGENTMPYGPDSWTMLSALLDAVADRAKVSETYALAYSFGGHMVLQCARKDPRIRGLVTASAPINEFFTDRQWQNQLPLLTKETLAHNAGMPFAELANSLADWRLSDADLAELDIPVCYLASLRDETISSGDVERVRANVRRLDLIVNDDQHASPKHVLESKLWTALSLMRMADIHTPQRAVVSGLWRVLRAGQRHRRPTPSVAGR